MPVSAELERRAARALLLSREGGAASELLSFAAALLASQARVAAALKALHGLSPLAGDPAADFPRLAELFPGFLHHLAPACPAELSGEARARAEAPGEEIEAALSRYWHGGAPVDFLARGFLRPCLGTLAAVGLPLRRPAPEGCCPGCGGPPSLSVRRPQEGSEAGERFLFCPLCGGEWGFGRIRCPGCLEESPARLPTFSTERHPGVRVEACEGCRRYVKSLDLTADARPIPEVDDLLSVAVDLWAQEQGFSRLEPGIAGV